LTVRWKPGARGEATVLWDCNPSQPFGLGFKVDHYYGQKVTAAPALTADEADRRAFQAPEGARYAVVVFHTPGAPDTVCESVSLVREP
jgi:hypothetical protein